MIDETRPVEYFADDGQWRKVLLCIADRGCVYYVLDLTGIRNVAEPEPLPPGRPPLKHIPFDAESFPKAGSVWLRGGGADSLIVRVLRTGVETDKLYLTWEELATGGWQVSIGDRKHFGPGVGRMKP